AEDGIRAFHVTGVQTCALPILNQMSCAAWTVCTGNMVEAEKPSPTSDRRCVDSGRRFLSSGGKDTISSIAHAATGLLCVGGSTEIGRAACRERVWITVAGGS